MVELVCMATLETQDYEGLLVAGLSKTFQQQVLYQDVSFQLPVGKTLALLGKSGCGKTTLLRILAGLESADSGSIYLQGQALTRLSPQQRGTLYLYQEPLLFPHLNVFENVAFGLRLQGQAADSITQQVDALLEELGIVDLQHSLPAQLSGGQRQRVAFGRALAVRPKLLLLDEPFGSLDAETRLAMQQLFAEMVHRHGTTTVFVTHDLQEALRVGDSFGRFEQGRLQLYPDRAGFCADPASGVERELAFWQQLATEQD